MLSLKKIRITFLAATLLSQISLAQNSRRQIDLDQIDTDSIPDYVDPKDQANSDIPKYVLDKKFWQNSKPNSVIFDPQSKRIYWREPDTQEISWAPADELNDLKCTKKMDHQDSKHILKTSAQISLNNSAVCTAFRTSDNTVMTNAHCAESAVETSHCGTRRSKASHSSPCVERALVSQIGKPLKKPVLIKFLINGRYQQFRCSSILAAGTGKDYAVLQCPGMNSEIPTVKISEKGLVPGETVTLSTWDYGNQQGRGPTVQRAELGRVTKYGGANLGAQSGNSGSAIFNKDNEVAALNWGAEVHNVPAYNRAVSAGGNPRGPARFHTLREVMADIEQKFPDVASDIRASTNSFGVKCGPADSAAPYTASVR